MKKNLFYLMLSIAGIIMGCSKDGPWGDGNPHKAPSHIDFVSPDLFPEGLAFDPIHNSFLVSTASMGQVGSVSFAGVYQAVTSDGGLNGSTGLKVDKSRRRLWVCNIGNGVGVYDLNNGAPIFFSDVSGLLPGEPVFLNDEVIDPDGNAYVTNSASPVIYKVDKNGKASVFFSNPDFAVGPMDFGFNGIQYDSHGFLLVTHTAFNQIIKIPVHSPEKFSVVKLGSEIVLPDGLLLSKDGKQLVVVSYDRVLSFTSTDQWNTGTPSTNYVTGSDVFASSLTSDGKRVFVVYSHLEKMLAGESQDSYAIQEVPLLKPTSF